MPHLSWRGVRHAGWRILAFCLSRSVQAATKGLSGELATLRATGRRPAIFNPAFYAVPIPADIPETVRGLRWLGRRLLRCLTVRDGGLGGARAKGVDERDDVDAGGHEITRLAWCTGAAQSYIGAAVATIPVALVAFFQFGWGWDFGAVIIASLASTGPVILAMFDLMPENKMVLLPTLFGTKSAR